MLTLEAWRFSYFAASFTNFRYQNRSIELAEIQLRCKWKQRSISVAAESFEATL